MRFLARHRWSIASLGLSSGTLLLALSIGLRFAGQPQPEPRLGRAVGLIDLSAMLAAFVTACVGLRRERSPACAFGALLLSIVSFLSYLSQ
jgi:hypothetical protein